MEIFLLMWNIGLTVFWVRLIWDVAKLECKVRVLEIEFNQFDKEFAEKLTDIYDNSTIIRKILEWRHNYETTTEEESL